MKSNSYSSREQKKGPSLAKRGGVFFDSPWLYVHTGRMTACGIVSKRKREGLQPEHLKDKRRGKIETFTYKAARRMREFLILNEAPCELIMEGSLTIPGEVTEEEWAQSWKRFRNKLRFKRIPLVWRVELQKRHQPHIHCIAWVDLEQAVWLKDWRSWVESLPERCQKHPSAKDRAVRWYAVKKEELKWLAYLVSHSSKKKQDQLGWKGKQWGIICRDCFSERPQEQFELCGSSMLYVVRNFKKFLKKKAGKKKVFLNPSMTRIIDPSIFKRLVQAAKADEQKKLSAWIQQDALKRKTKKTFCLKKARDRKRTQD